MRTKQGIWDHEYSLVGHKGEISITHSRLLLYIDTRLDTARFVKSLCRVGDAMFPENQRHVSVVLCP